MPLCTWRGINNEPFPILWAMLATHPSDGVFPVLLAAPDSGHRASTIACCSSRASHRNGVVAMFPALVRLTMSRLNLVASRHAMTSYDGIRCIAKLTAGERNGCLFIRLCMLATRMCRNVTTEVRPRKAKWRICIWMFTLIFECFYIYAWHKHIFALILVFIQISQCSSYELCGSDAHESSYRRIWSWKKTPGIFERKKRRKTKLINVLNFWMVENVLPKNRFMNTFCISETSGKRGATKFAIKNDSRMYWISHKSFDFLVCPCGHDFTSHENHESSFHELFSHSIFACGRRRLQNKDYFLRFPVTNTASKAESSQW